MQTADGHAPHRYGVRAEYFGIFGIYVREQKRLCASRNNTDMFVYILVDLLFPVHHRVQAFGQLVSANHLYWY